MLINNIINIGYNFYENKYALRHIRDKKFSEYRYGVTSVKDMKSLSDFDWSFHQNSIVFSNVLWDIYEKVGKNKIGDVDVIMCESPPLFLGYSALYLKRKKKAKLIFNVSDLWPESAEKLGVVTNKWMLKLAYNLEAKLYRKSVLVTGQTQGICKSINQRFPEVKTYWLPNGVDVSYYNPSSVTSNWRKENGFQENDILFLYAGIIGLAQGLEIILSAAEKVKNGDLTAQVPEEGLKKDEIKVLSLAFNRMVKQIDRQQRDLVIAQRALAWSDVARKVAHEIKNPLTPIQLAAERLLKKFKSQVEDRDSFEKYLNNIIKNSNEIRMIVSEFVNFARLPSPVFSQYEIVSIINQLVDARRLIHDKILYRVVSNVKTFELVCDIAQLNRVVVNLLQNAEDALENVSYQKKITVQIMADGDFVAISFSDNGLGFGPEVLENATKAYFTTKAKGTGLGLAIVEKIVQDHLGTLNIFNREEGGGCVRLTFNTEELRIKIK